jgi:hypothetical protein
VAGAGVGAGGGMVELVSLVLDQPSMGIDLQGQITPAERLTDEDMIEERGGQAKSIWSGSTLN